MRFGRFILILSFFSYFTWQASESLGIVLDPVSFGVGIVAATLTGATLFLVGDWWSSVTRPYHRQSIRLETNQTPSQITFAAFKALVTGIIVIVVVLAVIFVAYLRPIPSAKRHRRARQAGIQNMDTGHPPSRV
jgi:hypothetical protein